MVLYSKFTVIYVHPVNSRKNHHLIIITRTRKKLEEKIRLTYILPLVHNCITYYNNSLYYWKKTKYVKESCPEFNARYYDFLEKKIAKASHFTFQYGLENLKIFCLFWFTSHSELRHQRLKKNLSQQMSQKTVSTGRLKLLALAKEFWVSCYVKSDHKKPTNNRYFMKKNLQLNSVLS